MTISFKCALDGFPAALILREKRGEVLAANMANADTPDYKARDLDFKAALEKASSSLSLNSASPTRTDAKHLIGSNDTLGARLMYRNPFQASLDGNTVEMSVEQAKYAQNAIQYQATLTNLSGEFKDLMLAIRGQ